MEKNYQFCYTYIGGYMKISDIDKNKLSPMMKQYVDIKEENIYSS